METDGYSETERQRQRHTERQAETNRKMRTRRAKGKNVSSVPERVEKLSEGARTPATLGCIFFCLFGWLDDRFWGFCLFFDFSRQGFSV